MTGWFDRTLIYAIGGAAWTNGNASLTAGPSWYVANLGAGYPNIVNWNKSLTGYDVGGGVEYAWTPNWTVRVEYRYYNFGNNNNQAIYLGAQPQLDPQRKRRQGRPDLSVRRSRCGAGCRQILTFSALSFCTPEPQLSPAATPGFFAPWDVASGRRRRGVDNNHRFFYVLLRKYLAYICHTNLKFK